MAKKENKDILVWFGDTKDDFVLRDKIRNRCKYISESSFMKEAAEEKLNREQYMNNLLIQSTNMPVQQQNTKDSDDTPVKELDLESFLDGID